MPRLPLSAIRLLLGLVGGALVGALTPVTWPWEARILLSWVAFCLVNLLRMAHLLKLTPEQTKEVATTEDDTRPVAALITTSTALVSLVGVMVTLHQAAGEKGTQAYLLTALAVGTVVFSWLLVQAEYTVHYARQYYADGGGVEFNQMGSNEPLAMPSFMDFAYLSFTIGMTFQVSDTNLNTPQMRRLLLGHALLCYLFGAVIVAVTINALASILQ